MADDVVDDEMLLGRGSRWVNRVRERIQRGRKNVPVGDLHSGVLLPSLVKIRLTP